jgi:hypothetical protein
VERRSRWIKESRDHGPLPQVLSCHQLTFTISTLLTTQKSALQNWTDRPKGPRLPQQAETSHSKHYYPSFDLLAPSSLFTAVISSSRELSTTFYSLFKVYRCSLNFIFNWHIIVHICDIQHISMYVYTMCNNQILSFCSLRLTSKVNNTFTFHSVSQTRVLKLPPFHGFPLLLS